MKKIGIVVCTNSGADYYKFDHPVEVIHSDLHLGDKVYEDFVDIKADEFYEIISKNPHIDIKTSQPPMGQIIQKYEKLRDMGYNEILTISISTKLSGIYQSTILAAEMVEGITVRAIDSKSVSYGELYLVLEAIKHIKAGLSLEEVAQKVEAVIPNINILVYVDTVKFMVKNGRLSSTAGALASLLKIKPILRMNQHDGSLVAYEKIRTSKKALNRLYEIYTEETKDRDIVAFVVYTNNKPFAEEVKKHLLTIKPGIKIELVPLTPVVGAHAGPGTLGVGYIYI